MNLNPNKPTIVTSCQSAVEAEVLKIALEEAGIEATVEGAEMNIALGLPLSGHAVSGVQLVVRQTDLAEAAKVIQRTKDSWVGPKQDPWFCGKCLEEVDGGFEICWSCGESREDVEADFPATADSIEPMDIPDVKTEALGRETDNPYESPRAMGNVSPFRASEPAEEVDAERRMLVALGFSLVCFVLPAIPAIAALNEFATVSKSRTTLSFKATSMLWISIALIVIAHVIWFYFLYGQIFQ